MKFDGISFLIGGVASAIITLIILVLD
jgi:hypothetical protein